MSKTRLRDARKAYEGMDLESSREAHSERAIKDSLEEPTIHDVAKGQYIGDMVYGAIDGIVTTFAVVSGVAGASLAPGHRAHPRLRQPVRGWLVDGRWQLSRREIQERVQAS